MSQTRATGKLCNFSTAPMNVQDVSPLGIRGGRSSKMIRYAN
jgi:hypothetical protein